MEEILKGGGATNILAAISIGIALNIVIRVGEFLWAIKEKKEKETDSGIEKIKTDLNRAYMALRILAGPIKWNQIRKAIRDDEDDLDAK